MIRVKITKYFFAITLAGIIASGSAVQAAGAGAGAADKNVPEYVIDYDLEGKDIAIDPISKRIEELPDESCVKHYLILVTQKYITPNPVIDGEAFNAVNDLILESTTGDYQQLLLKILHGN